MLKISGQLKSTARIASLLLLTTALSVSVNPILDFGAKQASAQSIIKIKRSARNRSTNLKLGLNKAIVVDLPEDAHDILVANPEVADAVTRTSRRLYLFGKAVGDTNIFVFGENGEAIATLELNVERDITGLEKNLKRFLPDTDIKVEVISDNIVLSGSVRTPQDSAMAVNLATIFVTGGEATTRNETASSSGGDVAIFAEARQASQVVNLLKIEGEDQVTLKVTIAEVSRQVLKQLGINNSVSGGGGSLLGSFANNAPSTLGKSLATGALATITGNIGNMNISSYIRAMEQAGVMKTLAEPSLTAISGESASFYVGGEFRMVSGRDVDATTGGVSYDIDAVEYGIRLNFTPVVLSPGRISLKIKTEVSEPTFEGSASLKGGVSDPGMTILSIKKREAETSVELPSGGSIVLAGLVKDNIRQAMAGYPGVSKIPVLGALFRSKDFVRNETELVIIATPYLVRPVARNKIARPDDNFNPTSDGAGFFLGRVNKVYGRMETELPDGRYHGAIGFIYK